MYTWLICVLAVSPLIGIATSVLYTPSYRFRVINGIRTIDPLSIYTPAYFAVLGVALLLYVLSIVFAYLDSRELRRRGVDRPFHWAFAFIPVVVPGIYLIGRSIIVHRVASPRGLVPIWVWIASFVVSTVVGLAVAIPRLVDMLQNLPIPSR